MNGYEARRLVDRLTAAFPQTPLREGTIDLYVKYLADLDRTAADEVVEELIATETEFPGIATIRRAVIDRDLRLPSPLEAWQAACTRRGELHPLVKEVVSLFGGRFTIVGSDEPTIMRAQFLKAYAERREDELRAANVARYRKTA